MGALRKAGVWLGLVEDEDDARAYDDRVTTTSVGRDRDSRRTGDAGTPTSSPTTTRTTRTAAAGTAAAAARACDLRPARAEPRRRAGRPRARSGRAGQRPVDHPAGDGSRPRPR